MRQVIGDLLPLAVGIAISPIPIIAVILMLLSRQATKTGTGFLLGWLAGIVVATTAFLVLVGQANNQASGQPSTLSAVLKLVFGLLLLFMAANQWKSRPRPGQLGVMPKWMSAVDSFSFVKALGLGFLLSAVNPKNLLMCAGAGTTIGAAHLSGSDEVIVVVIFTLIAGCTVLVPVIGYLIARNEVQAPLNELKVWLTQNNATVMAVLLLVIGAVLIGKGIAAF